MGESSLYCFVVFKGKIETSVGVVKSSSVVQRGCFANFRREFEERRDKRQRREDE